MEDGYNDEDSLENMLLLYLDNAKLQRACQDNEQIVKTVAQFLAEN